MWIERIFLLRCTKNLSGGANNHKIITLLTNMLKCFWGSRFYTKFWNANVIFIWCTNVKEGVMLSKISFKNLIESTNHTKSVGHLSNVVTNNTKTTLSHSTRICNSNYDVWSTTRNPQCETGTRGTLQRAIVMTLLYSSTPYKQKMEIRGCMHDHCTEIITRASGVQLRVTPTCAWCIC